MTNFDKGFIRQSVLLHERSGVAAEFTVHFDIGAHKTELLLYLSD